MPGDPDAATPGSVEALHERYSGPLFVYAWRRLGDRQAAEEVVQDTLTAAWRHADRFDATRGGVSGWLFSIARNLVIDHLRRQGARPRAVAPLSLVRDREAGDLGSEADRAVEAWQLAEALAGLSAEHRQAIVHVHYLGFTVREAATRLGLPEGTVKSRLYYGLRALRLRLEETGVVG